MSSPLVVDIAFDLIIHDYGVDLILLNSTVTPFGSNGGLRKRLRYVYRAIRRSRFLLTVPNNVSSST